MVGTGEEGPAVVPYDEVVHVMGSDSEVIWEVESHWPSVSCCCNVSTCIQRCVAGKLALIVLCIIFETHIFCIYDMRGVNSP